MKVLSKANLLRIRTATIRERSLNYLLQCHSLKTSVIQIPFFILPALEVHSFRRLLTRAVQMLTTSLFCISMIACQSISSQDKAKTHVELGLAYLQNHNSALAKEKLLMALQEAPNWPPAEDAMAYYLERTGEIQLAESYYHRAIEKGVLNNGAAFNNYGSFLCRQKRPVDAQQMFLKAVSDPNYLNIADAYQNAGWCALTLPYKNRVQIANDYFAKAKRHSLGN